MSELELLEASFAFARTKIVGARGAAPDIATPCRDWTLRRLLNHVVASADGFAGIVDGSYATSAWPTRLIPERRRWLP